MGRKEKMIRRLLCKPKDFAYSELVTLLSYFSYDQDSAGRTSGSAVRFVNAKTGHVIRIHRPHPEPDLKPYILSMVINDLRKEGFLK